MQKDDTKDRQKQTREKVREAQPRQSKTRTRVKQQDQLTKENKKVKGEKGISELS